jgi:uncharacterized protein YjdB
MKSKNINHSFIILLLAFIIGCLSVSLSGCGTTVQPTQNNNNQEYETTVNSVQGSTSEIEVESVKLNKGKCSIKVGKTVKLKATVYPKDSEDKYVEWVSDDDDIAIVNSEGLVTGKKAGVTNIIARATNSKEASCTITVKKKNKTSKTVQYINQPQNHENNSPFYGIWCTATKNYSNAKKAAYNLQNKGFDAEVILTTDWSNLNTERWYVVTAGIYSTRSNANAALSSVRTIYPDAYVKFTGEWQG